MQGRLAGEGLVVLAPSGAATDQGKEEKQQARDFQPENVGGPGDGLGGSSHARGGSAQEPSSRLRVEGMTGDRTEPGTDNSGGGASLTCFAQTLILRSQTNKIVPRQWDGQIPGAPNASKD